MKLSTSGLTQLDHEGIYLSISYNYSYVYILFYFHVIFMFLFLELLSFFSFWS